MCLINCGKIKLNRADSSFPFGKKTVCFADSPFARARLTGAAALCADGQEYPILDVDDHDAGWLMVTLDIDDATILWDQELTTK